MEVRLPRGHFCGSLLKRDDVGGFVLTEYSYPPELRISKHLHEQAYFCIVLQGNYTESYGKRTRTCERRTVTFHPAGEAHSDHFHGEGGRIFSVEIDPQWVERVAELSSIFNYPDRFCGGLMASLVVRIYNEFHEIDAASRLAIEGLSLEVVAEALRQQSRSPERKAPRWLEQARELLHDQFSEHYSIRQIAGSVGVHPVHLVREFRRHYHLTVGEYLRRLRVEFACRKLTDTDTPLIDIALAAGFSQQSHFTKTFKKLTGVTPNQYRTSSRLR
ncbi:MAG TPA: AraC family transcriptional regulator [Blastocatellia bacterium]|nr:AraC family transcriptional regulator [Blastocatellia bacterium]